MSTTSRRPYINCAERTMIANVVEACMQEKQNKNITGKLTRPYARAAAYTKRSHRSVETIWKERREQPVGKLKSPRKRTNKMKNQQPVEIDSSDQNVIRQTVVEFYTKMKIVPTIRKLLLAVRDKIDFPWGREKLRKVLKSMGFAWKKSCSKRTILTERNDIIDWRYRYLVKMQQLRRENRRIFFIGETWVDPSLTFRKCWQAEGLRGVLENVYGSNRYFIVHIGSSDGFLPGGKLVFNAGTSTGDHHQMNYTNFSKWMEQQVLPNLPTHSVLVMDNAPYHSLEENKPPCRSATKTDMISWLMSNGVQVDSSQRKPVLFDLITARKPRRKIYKIDQLIDSRGHIVVRLPPYNCHLNPIELVWAKLKEIVRSHNVNGDLNMSKLGELVQTGLDQITADDWKGYCHDVEKLEATYWEQDTAMEDAVDSFVTDTVDEDDDQDDDEDEDSESSSDVDSASTDDEVLTTFGGVAGDLCPLVFTCAR